MEEENGAGRLEDDLAISYKANTFFSRYPVITRPDIYPKELETWGDFESHGIPHSAVIVTV